MFSPSRVRRRSVCSLSGSCGVRVCQSAEQREIPSYTSSCHHIIMSSQHHVITSCHKHKQQTWAQTGETSSYDIRPCLFLTSPVNSRAPSHIHDNDDDSLPPTSLTVCLSPSEMLLSEYEATHYVLHIMYCTLCTAHYVLHIIYCTLCTAHYVLLYFCERS